MSIQQTKPMEQSCDYERYEGRMEHEDILISQRISWLLTAQAFLLSPYVLLHNNRAVALLEYVIVVIGIISTALTYISVAAGIHAMLRLKAAYDAHMRNREPLAVFKPVVDLSRIETRHGLIAPRGLIYCFLTAWVTLLCISLKSHHKIQSLTWNSTAFIGVFAGLIVSLLMFCIDKAQLKKVHRECAL